MFELFDQLRPILNIFLKEVIFDDYNYILTFTPIVNENIYSLDGYFFVMYVC